MENFNQIPSFPKNLAYNLKKLQGSINKQRVKILADNTSYKSTQQIRFNLPRGAILDLRSLVIYATGATSGTGSSTSYVHFGRLGLHSLIENLTVSVNNITLSSIQSYNFLYNLLFDMEGGSIDQATKRMITELYDPSVNFSSEAADSGSTVAKNENKIIAKYTGKVDGTTANDSAVKFCANNFLGFLGSCSCPCISTDDIGDIQITITLANTGALFYSVPAAATAVPTFTGLDFTLSDVYLTVERLTFTNSLYLQLKQAQLMSDGLDVGFYDYYTITGSTITKSSGCALNASINSASLNQLIGTFRRSDYQTIKPLLLYGNNSKTSSEAKSFDEYLANVVTNTNTSTGCDVLGFGSNLGDGFNNTAYHQRCANDITGTSWAVNSVNLSGYSVPPVEIFNNTIQSLGFNNIDVATAGLHPGCRSLEHWKKYYFCDVISLENISQDNNFWVSGFDGQNGGIVINYNATFASTNAGTVYPYVFAQSTKVMNVKAGRALDII